MNKIIIDPDAINNVITEPQHRKLAYSIYALLGVILGAMQTAFVIYGYEAVWFNAVIGVYVFLALPFGGLAATNTPTEQEEIDTDNSAIDEITE